MVKLREGMRRLGIVLGILGTVFGGFIAYAGLAPRVRDQVAYARFKEISNSPAVQSAQKGASLESRVYCAQLPAELPADFFEKQTAVAGEEDRMTKEGRVSPDHSASCDGRSVRPSDVFDKIADPNATIIVELKPIVGGIREVGIDGNGGISSVTLSDNETLLRCDPPHKVLYLLALIYPALGFLLPWAAVKTCVWVASGFAS